MNDFSRSKAVSSAFVVVLALAIFFAAFIIAFTIQMSQHQVVPSPSASPSPSSSSVLTPSPLPSGPIVSPSATVTFGPSSSPTIPPTPAASIPVRDAQNWAGYITYSDYSNPQPVVTSVSASWVVPVVASSVSDSYSAAWIGIGGGPYDSTLIQCGTEHDFVEGQAVYTCWYETLPSGAVDVTSISLSPGDRVQASIQLVNDLLDQWRLTITDVTNGQTFRGNFFYAASCLSADWIVERPKVNGVLSPLADFGSVKFSNCQAEVGGAVGDVGSFGPLKVDLYSSTAPEANGFPLANTSVLSQGGNGFTVTFLSSG